MCVAVNSNWLGLGIGITSRLNRNSGTQNEWMTSSETSTMRTRLFTGTTITGISVELPMVEMDLPADGSEDG